MAGGNVTIAAQGDIKHQTADGKPDSEKQVPTNWLYRRSYVGAMGASARQTTAVSFRRQRLHHMVG